MSERPIWQKSLSIVAEGDVAAPPPPQPPPAPAEPPRGCLCFGGTPPKVPSAAANSLAQPGGAQLCHASYAGDLEAVTEALSAGVHANATRYDGASPLLLAAQEGHAEVVKALLAGGAEPDLRFEASGATPLLLAAQHGHASCCSALLSCGAGARLESSPGGSSAVHLAAAKGHVEVLRVLLIHDAALMHLPKGCDGAGPLFVAAQEGGASAVRLLLRRGADPDARTHLDATPLHACCSGSDDPQHLEIARVLLAAGAQVDSKRLDGVTPLMLTASTGSLALARLLLECGASVHARGKERKLKGACASHYAALCGHAPVLRLLLQRGADSEALTLAKERPVDITTDAECRDTLKAHYYLRCRSDESLVSPPAPTSDGLLRAIADRRVAAVREETERRRCASERVALAEEAEKQAKERAQTARKFAQQKAERAELVREAALKFKSAAAKWLVQKPILPPV